MAEAAGSGVWPLRGWKIPAVVGGTLALLIAVASTLPVFWTWQETVDLYLLFKARGPRAVPEAVVIVPIDGRATRRLFLPAADVDFERCADVRLDQAPASYRNPNPPDVLTRWPRCLHARALDALAAGDPDAIVMDISFRPRSDPSGLYAEQDRALAASMRRFGRVVLARKMKSEERAQERLQPIAAEIEAAAIAVAPFLLVGDHLQRADKFCTFVEDNAWSGPCMPALAHQVAALGTYAQLRSLLFGSDSKDADLLPAHLENLLAAGSLQAPVSLIRHLATSDLRIGAHLRTSLAVGGDAKAVEQQVRLRELTDIYLGAATRYFNFYGAPGIFRTLRYEALVAGNGERNLAPGSLRGKTVFIGFAEYGRPEPIEHFTTPFTTRNNVMSGVELAATAYGNLLDGSAIEPIPALYRGLIVLALGLVCLIVCVMLPRKLSLPICVIVALGYFALALGVFQQHALWLPVLMPLGFAAPVGVATGLTFEHLSMRGELEWYRQKYLRTEEERAYLERVTAELLPPVIRQRVMDHRQTLPQLLASGPGACVNTDIEGSTKYAETRDSNEVRITLNEYFHLLDTVLNEEQVLTSDYTADGLMAVWTVDQGSADNARERVCEAALRLAFAAEEFRLSRYLKDPDKQHFDTRVGACYGDLQVGMLGGASHGGYRPIGDVANTATALQSFNKVMQTKLLVTGNLVEGLEQKFLYRELGYFVLPKKEKVAHVFELICERRHASPGQLAALELFRQALKAYRERRQEQAIELFSRLGDDGPAEYYAKLCVDRRHYGDAAVVVEPGDVEWARARAQAKATVQKALRGPAA